MSVKLISVTPDAEKTMAYVARVSNPNNQENPNYAKLLGYCIKHNHWSVFEQSFMSLRLRLPVVWQLRSFVIGPSHIRNFHNAMLILPYSQRRSHCQNYAVKTPRIVKILLMILTRLRFRNTKC